MGMLAAAGAILAMVVGWRRRGTLAMRMIVAVAFFTGAILVATYSELAAVSLQRPPPPAGAHAWQSLDGLMGMVALVVGLPIVLLVMLLMFRTWTWSAHDSADDVTG
jgi:protein-S-isoprenylcysteine O-methyltransferase Ste14